MPQLSGSGESAGKIERRENRAEEQPGPELTRHQIGVLALPAESAAGGKRLFHDGGGIDENLHVAAGICRQPARQLLQARLDQVVIVIALRVDRDGGAVALLSGSASGSSSGP